MTHSSDNQTSDQILDYLDHAFSSVGLFTKNPMAYRRGDTGIDIHTTHKKTYHGYKNSESKCIYDDAYPNEYILLPNGVDVNIVFQELGRLLGERYLLILSSIYTRGLFVKKENACTSGYLRCNWKILRLLGGEKYSILMQAGLNTFGHIKISTKGYIPDVRSTEYALNRIKLDCRTQFRYVLTSKSALRARRKYQNDSRRQFIDVHAVYGKIAHSTSELCFDYVSAIDYASSLTDSGKRIRYKALIEKLLIDPYIWTIDNQGRNYTLLVGLPRDLRRFFSWKGLPLFLADLSSSQPLLHCLLYDNECPEKTKYLTAIHDGFLMFMKNASGSSADLSNEAEKKKMKKDIFRQIFYGRIGSETEKAGIYATAFKTEFPVLWNKIQDCKQRHLAKQSSLLARTMISIEANGVFHAIDALKHKPYPLITIHDAVVTTRDGVDDVIKALHTAFRPLDIQPRIKTERISL